MKNIKSKISLLSLAMVSMCFFDINAVEKTPDLIAADFVKELKKDEKDRRLVNVPEHPIIRRKIIAKIKVIINKFFSSSEVELPTKEKTDTFIKFLNAANESKLPGLDEAIMEISGGKFHDIPSLISHLSSADEAVAESSVPSKSFKIEEVYTSAKSSEDIESFVEKNIYHDKNGKVDIQKLPPLVKLLITNSSKLPDETFNNFAKLIAVAHWENSGFRLTPNNRVTAKLKDTLEEIFSTVKGEDVVSAKAKVIVALGEFKDSFSSVANHPDNATGKLAKFIDEIKALRESYTKHIAASSEE